MTDLEHAVLWLDASSGLSSVMPMQMTIGTVRAGQSLYKKVSFTPVEAGRHQLYVTLHSNQLADVSAARLAVLRAQEA